MDNLKLGYGGTKTEMERLLADAKKLTGINYNIENYSDIIEAIHVIQDNIGITGTTAAEAAETIQGSTASMKAAWQNLVTGLARPDADLGKLIDNFVDSASASINNLLPVIQQTLKGISKAIQSIAPVIAEGLPDFIASVAPDLFAAGVELLKGIGKAIATAVPILLPQVKQLLTGIVKGITGNAGTVITAITRILTDIKDAIINNLPTIIEAGGEMLGAIADGLIENLPQLIDNAVEIVTFLAEQLAVNFPKVANKAGEIIGTIVHGIGSHLGELLDSAVQIVTTLTGYIGEQLPELIPAAVRIVSKLATELTKPERLSELFQSALDLIDGLIDGLLSQETIDAIFTTAPKVIENLVSALTSKENLDKMVSTAENLIAKLVGALTNLSNWMKIMNGASDVVDSLRNGMENVKSYMSDAADQLIQEFLDSIGLGDVYDKGKEVVSTLKDGILGVPFVGTVVEKVGKFATTHSPVTAANPFVVVGSQLDRIDTIVSTGKNVVEFADAFSGSDSGSSGTTNYYGPQDPSKFIGPVKKYASGGIVTKEQFAIIGEAGTEAVLPLENNTGWMDKLADRLSQRSGITVHNEIVINGDGMTAVDTIGEVVIEKIDEALAAYALRQSRAVGAAWR